MTIPHSRQFDRYPTARSSQIPYVQGMVRDAIIAGYYSTLAGVLSGFAFAALMFTITIGFQENPHSEGGLVKGRPSGSTIAMLFAAFISLALASLTYAVVAGAQPIGTGTAAAESAERVAAIGNGVAAPTFGISAYLLMMAIHLLILDSHLTPEARSASVKAVGFTLFIADSYILVGAIESAKKVESQPLFRWTLATMIPALIIVLLVTLWRPGYAPRWVRRLNQQVAARPTAARVRSQLRRASTSILEWRPVKRAIEIAPRHSIATWSAELSLLLVLSFTVLSGIVIGTESAWPSIVGVVAMAVYSIVGVAVVRRTQLRL